MKPRDAETLEQICSLETDHTECDGFWMLLSGPSITICRQKPGESPVAQVTLPRSHFHQLIDWYLKDQTPT